MARLKLKSGQSYKTVGHLLVAMAKAAHQRPDEPFNADGAYQLENEFQSLFEDKFLPVPDLLKHVETPPVDDGVVALFHFDRTVVENGKTMRIVNIAVPDFQGKLTTRAEKGQIFAIDAERDDFDLTDVAAEAFGFVVILGCVG